MHIHITWRHALISREPERQYGIHLVSHLCTFISRVHYRGTDWKTDSQSLVHIHIMWRYALKTRKIERQFDIHLVNHLCTFLRVYIMDYWLTYMHVHALYKTCTCTCKLKPIQNEIGKSSSQKKYETLQSNNNKHH